MKFFGKDVACGPIQSISLELYGIRILTGEISIALYSRFEATIDGRSHFLDPVAASGDVASLWQLIGRDIVAVDSDKWKFQMEISGEAKLICEYASGNEHINIWGPGPDTFTALPEYQG